MSGGVGILLHFGYSKIDGQLPGGLTLKARKWPNEAGVIVHAYALRFCQLSYNNKGKSQSNKSRIRGARYMLTFFDKFYDVSRVIKNILFNIMAYKHSSFIQVFYLLPILVRTIPTTNKGIYQLGGIGLYAYYLFTSFAAVFVAGKRVLY